MLEAHPDDFMYSSLAIVHNVPSSLYISFTQGPFIPQNLALESSEKRAGVSDLVLSLMISLCIK